jgi:Glycosyl transferase family 2
VIPAAFDVSVVIPAHNGLPDVLAAVAGAQGQTLRPREIIVVDDRSSDGTAAAVEARFGDGVRLVRGSFGSAAAARNAGWRSAAGAWVAFLDADDLWFEDKLATAAQSFAAAPRAAWFFSDGAFLDAEGRTHASWLATFTEFSEPYVGQPVAELFEVNFVLTSSVVVRRDVLAATGGFDERMTHAEDLELWIRLARGWPATASGRPLVRYQHLSTGLSRQTERRLLGDVELFGRLGADTTLPTGLRRRALRRRALARYKLAVLALRAGDGRTARQHLRAAGWFPERAMAVVAAWGVSLLSPGLIGRLRRQQWATHSVGRQMTVQRRVVLRGAMPGRADT